MSVLCHNCGRPLEEGATFCTACGQRVAPPQTQPVQNMAPQNPGYAPQNQGFAPQNQGFAPQNQGFAPQNPGFAPQMGYAPQMQSRGGLSDVFGKITGERGRSGVKPGDLFSGVFKMHSKEERDKQFICGTKFTTPKEESMFSSWSGPWMWSRVFVALFSLFVALFIFFAVNTNNNFTATISVVGALLMPLTVFLFLWELNVPRNVSLLGCAPLFLAGAGAGVFAILILNSFEEVNFGYTVLYSFITQTLLVLFTMIFLFVRQERFILNGTVVGACIGAGFAFVELLEYLLAFSRAASWNDEAFGAIWVYVLFSVGGHVLWGALIGSSLMLGKGDQQPVGFALLGNWRFLATYGYCFILQWFWDVAMWDTDVKIGFVVLAQALCILFILPLAFILISAGLKQAARYAEAAKQGRPIRVMSRQRPTPPPPQQPQYPQYPQYPQQTQPPRQ